MQRRPLHRRIFGNKDAEELAGKNTELLHDGGHGPIMQKRFAGKNSGFMNSYAKRLMTYQLVHRLHHQGFSISYISKHCELDWRSVKKYLAMSEAQYEAFLQTQLERKKELEPYEAFIRTKLSSYPDTSAAQMHDWLKEHHAHFPQVNPKTVFNFVSWVRRKYHLSKTEAIRQYQMVEETPYGAQAQADFGEPYRAAISATNKNL